MRRLALILVSLLLSILVPAGPASAADELGISRDGAQWSADLSAPLFDPSFRWVPGDSETATFFVRNQAKNAGALDVTMLATQVHDLIDSGDLTVSARFEQKPWISAATAGRHSLIDSETVPPKGVRAITIKVDFHPRSSNQTQGKALDLRFEVALSQRGAVVAAPQTGGGSGNGNNGTGSSGGNGAGQGIAAAGSLPDTGSDVSPLMVLIGVLLCAGGAALALMGGRNKATKETEHSHA